MTPALNPDYELVYVDQEADKIFLKNHFFKNMVSLSKIEYEIIQFYTNNPDCEKVFTHYAERYEMSRDFVYALVHKAELSGILVSEGYLARKNKILEESNRRTNNGVVYLLVARLESLLLFFGLKAKIELRGNFKYYRLLSFNLQNTKLEKLCASGFFQIAVITLYFVSMATVLYSLAGIDSFIIAKNTFRAGLENTFWVIPILLTGFLVFTFLHEMGHFLLYKRYGGLTSEMGFALMTGIVPTPYVTTSSLHLWKSRGRRILVMAGGMLVDILVLLICVYFTYLSTGLLSFCGYVFSIMMVYRTIFNINPFIPRTDGYFIWCEIISQPSFHSLSHTNFVAVTTKFKNREWLKVKLSEAGYSFYYVLSVFFMAANILILFAPLILFLFYAIVKTGN